ncbi:MAG: class I SAM-dependent methyltransferase [Patescibacteria group bacterium]
MIMILRSVQAELSKSGLLSRLDRQQSAAEKKYLAAHKRQLNFLFRLCRKNYRPGAKFLDIGSSFGYPCLGAKLIGYDAYGLDQSPKVAQFADRLAHFGIKNVAGDLAVKKSPFSSRKFDVILVSAIPETVDHHPARFFGEVARLLKPGGIVIMTSANLLRFRNLAKAFIGRQRQLNAKNQAAGEYYCEFTATDLAYLLTKNGLNVEKVKYRNFHHAGPAWLAKIISHVSGLISPHRKGHLVVTARKV